MAARRGLPFGIQVSSHDWLGLLPGYVGREDASLLAMLQGFVRRWHTGNRFWMHDHESLSHALTDWSDAARRPLVLFGVTWALLDWVRRTCRQLRLGWRSACRGHRGHKGRGEPTREEVLAELQGRLPMPGWPRVWHDGDAFPGYAKDGLQYVFPKWVMPLVRDHVTRAGHCLRGAREG